MTKARPLSGKTVLDLSRALSGPFCAAILGDLGAEVIKVEPCPDGDMIRTWGPFDRGESVYYLSGNRNKKSIGIDFRSADGKALLRKLALKSDVLLENFKPGVLAKIGLDPAELRRERPNLIIGSISGFGSEGPLATRPGFDQIAQGYAGFMSFTGTPESGPTRVGVAIGDLTSGMWLAIGLLSAMIGLKETGEGQHVDTSLLASLTSLLSVQGQRYLSLGEVASPTGNVHPVIAPYGVFMAGDGELNIGAATQGMWLTLCNVIGASHLAEDRRFLTNADRMAHRQDLRELIEERLAERTREEWTTEFVAAGIPAGPINDIHDALSDRQVHHLGLIETIDHPILGPLRQLSNPLRIDGEGGNWIRSSPPVFGQHTCNILKDFGFDQPDITRWLADRTVYQNPITS